MQVIQFGNSKEFAVVDLDKGEMYIRGGYKQILMFWIKNTGLKTITKVIKV